MGHSEPADQRSLNPVSKSIRPSVTHRRTVGVAVGLLTGVGLLAVLLSPSQAQLHAPGAMNTGHESLACDSCHRPADGTIRQQLQANVKYWLGMRKTEADFGNKDVGNADCLQCHERPFDRHPVFRFNEPRFREARQAIAPQNCVSCHREHSDVRVTARSGYCVECHSDLELKNDPIDVSHVDLARQQRWQTCLGCHDFHGNHVMDTPKRLSDAHSLAELDRYFAGGKSPYPNELRARARKERLDVASVQ